MMTLLLFALVACTSLSATNPAPASPTVDTGDEAVATVDTGDEAVATLDTGDGEAPPPRR